MSIAFGLKTSKLNKEIREYLVSAHGNVYGIWRCPGEEESLDAGAEFLGAWDCMPQAARPRKFRYGTAGITPRSPLNSALLPGYGFAAAVSV